MPRARKPFQAELPVTAIVRRHSEAGGEAASFARAMTFAVRERLCETAGELDLTPHEPPPPDLLALAHNALALLPVSLDENTLGAVTPEWLEELHRLARPDADHKRHGRWYTAKPIGRYMARRVLEEAHARRSPGPITALDPACGCGALLIPLLEEMVARLGRPAPEAVAIALAGITAADVDAEALETAVFRLRLCALRLAGERVDVSPRAIHGSTLALPPGEVAPDGVDVVLMNPPYLGNRYFEALPDPARARTALKKEFGWNDDLYAHFLQRAWDWLRLDGALCAITSDTFLTIPSKARTRAHLRARALREIVRVPPSAFAANVNTCITIAINAPPELFDTLVYLDAREAPEEAWKRLDAAPAPPGVERLTAPGQVYADRDVPIFRPTPRAVALFERFWRGKAAPPAPGETMMLGDVAPAKDCGINSGNVRHKLFFAESGPGREMLIQGRQLERYVVRWDSPNAKYRWVDVNYQPDPSEQGVGRGGRVSRTGETWSFRGELAIHKQPERLFLRQTEDDLFAAYMHQEPYEPTYTDNTLFTLTLNDLGRSHGITYLYLLGLLNSAFLNELYHALSQEEGRAQAQVKVGYVNRLPIVIPTFAQRAEVEAYVKEAIALQTAGKPIAAMQRRLDALVNELYRTKELPNG